MDWRIKETKKRKIYEEMNKLKIDIWISNNCDSYDKRWGIWKKKGEKKRTNTNKTLKMRI